MADYIPLVTYDYKLAFVQATNILPHEIQQIIWYKTLETQPIAPPAPIKPSKRLNRLMNGWAQRKL